jgi:hypothetical protein
MRNYSPILHLNVTRHVLGSIFAPAKYTYGDRHGSDRSAAGRWGDRTGDVAYLVDKVGGEVASDLSVGGIVEKRSHPSFARMGHPA